MSVSAVVMAGGKGKRMTLAEEKPLLRVGGKPVIEFVLLALKNSRSVNDIVVTVSDFTPKTAKHLEAFPVKVLKTPGKEYVSDLAYAIKTLGLQTVLAVAADLPLLTAEVIDDIVANYFRCGKPALAVAVPVETKQRFGLGLNYSFEFGGKRVVPAGINMIDGRRIDVGELDQAVYVVDKVEVAVNINTVAELKIAEEQFTLMSKRLS
ncbi:MAG TPA: NTP transferase domain-containing protein [Candidatus Bathyarchaeia archaeon]|nr:NTP transferase domain-containing protein [Candidatus Bathyarchaeia archaeon]